MTAFYLINLLIGGWLAIANYFSLLRPNALYWSNIVLGLIVAIYSAYHLLRGNVNVTNRAR